MIKIGTKKVNKIMVGDKEVNKIIVGNGTSTGNIVYQKGTTPTTWTSVALYGPIVSSQTFVNGAVGCTVDSSSPYAYHFIIRTSALNASYIFTPSDTISDILLKWYNAENSTNYTQIRNITITPMIYNKGTSDRTYYNIKVRVSSSSNMSTYTSYSATSNLTLSAGTYNLVPGVTIDPNSFISYSSFVGTFFSSYYSINAKPSSWGGATYINAPGGFAFEFEVA